MLNTTPGGARMAVVDDERSVPSSAKLFLRQQPDANAAIKTSVRPPSAGYSACSRQLGARIPGELLVAIYCAFHHLSALSARVVPAIAAAIADEQLNCNISYSLSLSCIRHLVSV